MELDFSSLPDLAQIIPLKRIATNLWGKEEVQAIWVEGSFGQGTADLYSDVDLRIAVTADSLHAWETPDIELLFDGRCIAHQRLFLKKEGILFHVMLDTGGLYDLGIQAVQQVSPDKACIVLGCRNSALAGAFSESNDAKPQSRFTDPDPSLIRQAIVEFWLHTHKHAKVLFRELDAMLIVGLQIEREILLRLWAIHATGQDAGAGRPTIHSLTPQVRSIVAIRPRPLDVLGAPGRTRPELIESIELHRDEVASIGRTLASKYGFVYPEIVEATVRAGWHDFVSSQH